MYLLLSSYLLILFDVCLSRTRQIGYRSNLVYGNRVLMML
jgi:hypothetical protein